MEPQIDRYAVSSAGAEDERWRLEFTTQEGGGVHWVDGMYKWAAEDLLSRWHQRDPGTFRFCKICPDGPDVACPHRELVQQRGWRFTDIHCMRIMPMREAL